jgi:drug/metabolite transporter (DMT)-like permease
VKKEFHRYHILLFSLPKFVQLTHMAEESKVDVEQNIAPEPPSAQPNRYRQFAERYGALCVAIFSHFAFGLQPVFSRYLQSKMAHPLPAFSLITVSFALNCIVFSPKLVYSGYKNRTNLLRTTIDREFFKRIIRVFYSDFLCNWLLWLYLFACVSRVPANFFASRLTNAIYVQLIGLLSPFVISFLTFCFLRNTREGKMDRLSWKTFIALLATIAGCVLIILGGTNDVKKEDAKWWEFLINFKVEWQSLGKGLTMYDAIGMGCAFLFVILLSSYMLMTQVLKTHNVHSASKVLTQGENIYMFQSAAIALTYALPSIIMEDWSPWLKMTLKDWIMFSAFIIIVQLAAQLFMVLAIQKIGANTVGSTVSLRMVSAIIFSAILLDEELSSAWQVIGAVIVLISVSLFLYYQHKQQKQFIEAEKKAKELQEIDEIDLPEVNDDHVRLTEESGKIETVNEENPKHLL